MASLSPTPGPTSLAPPLFPDVSLCDLRKHSSDQEARIRQPNYGFDSETTICALWTEFRAELWGRKPVSFQKEEPVEIDDSDLIPNVKLPDTHCLATLPKALPSMWGIRSQRILVRSEYSEAEREAISASTRQYCKMFIVAGQLGVGKSVFLLLLLMRRLAYRLPTVLQVNPDSVILFHEGGVSQLTRPGNDLPYTPLFTFTAAERIWALVDMSPALQDPPAILKYDSPFFVVNASSPRSEDREWFWRVYHDMFYMNPWSISELLQARSFLGDDCPTGQQLSYLHNEFGALSPGDMVRFAKAPRKYEDVVLRAISNIEPSQLPDIFQNPAFHPSSQYLAVIESSPVDHDRFMAGFASRRIFELLWEKHIQHRPRGMRCLYDVFRSVPLPYEDPHSTTAARWIFESRIHQLLVKRQEIQLFRVRGHRVEANLVYDDYTTSADEDDSITLCLTESEAHDLAWETGQLRENWYYQFKPNSFPAVNSMLLLKHNQEPVLLVFKIACDKSDRDSTVHGLREIDDLGLASDVSRCYVVVAPEGIEPTITVPMEYLKDEGLVDPLADRGFGVFHRPVSMSTLFKD